MLHQAPSFGDDDDESDGNESEGEEVAKPRRGKAAARLAARTAARLAKEAEAAEELRALDVEMVAVAQPEEESEEQVKLQAEADALAAVAAAQAEALATRTAARAAAKAARAKEVADALQAELDAIAAEEKRLKVISPFIVGSFVNKYHGHFKVVFFQ